MHGWNMSPEDLIRLKHILAEAEEACPFDQDVSFDEFIHDRKNCQSNYPFYRGYRGGGIEDLGDSA